MMREVRYLVDTDWSIHYRHDAPRVVQRLDELALEGIGLSIVSLTERYDGALTPAASPQDEQRLQDWLTLVQVINLDDEICRRFARARRRLREAGNRIGDLDLLIGATARHHGLTRLTNNRRHFERLTGLSIISV